MDKREGVAPERPTELPSVPPPPPPPRGYARNGGYCYCGSWDRRIAELEAEVAELRKDKARMRECIRRTREDVGSRSQYFVGGYGVFRGVLDRLDAAMERKA